MSTPIPTAGSKPLGLWAIITVIALFALARSEGAPFTLRGPAVDTNSFRVTTFATNLSYPLGMARLADGSLAVVVNQGANFFSAPGRIVRLLDADDDGVADGPPTLLYSGLPAGQTSLRRGGNLLFVTGQGSGKPIIILRPGATPGAPLSLAGAININYPGSWYHPHSALFIHDVPGTTNGFDLFFQLGSQHNYDPTTANASISSTNVTGAIGAILGDSIYRLTIIDLGTSVRASNLTHIARGLRNATGFVFHPETGDFYFQDNGIDGLSDANEPLSADELNMIRAPDLGGAVEYFGFPTNYIEYRTGRNVGGLGVQPLVAFQPLPNPLTGNESEGPNDIVFAPPGFPPGFNNGIFVSFHGKFNGGGLANEENPLVYVDLTTTNYFHFIEGRQEDVGHLDGLLATGDSLFVADLATNGNLSFGSGFGVIYQIKSLVLPPVGVTRSGGRVELTWDFGTLQSASSVSGPWSDIGNAASPYSVEVDQSPTFFRTRN